MKIIFAGFGSSLFQREGKEYSGSIRVVRFVSSGGSELEAHWGTLQEHDNRADRLFVEEVHVPNIDFEKRPFSPSIERAYIARLKQLLDAQAPVVENWL